MNRIIGGGIYKGKFYAFDPLTKRWTSQTIQGGSPGSMVYHAIDYDPVDNVFIFISGRHTWAYRYKRAKK